MSDWVIMMVACAVNFITSSLFIFTLLMIKKEQKILSTYINTLHVRQQIMAHQMGYELISVDEIQTH